MASLMSFAHAWLVRGSSRGEASDPGAVALKIYMRVVARAFEAQDLGKDRLRGEHSCRLADVVPDSG